VPPNVSTSLIGRKEVLQERIVAACLLAHQAVGTRDCADREAAEHRRRGVDLRKLLKIKSPVFIEDASFE
jgi:hypothetical protein